MAARNPPTPGKAPEQPLDSIGPPTLQQPRRLSRRLVALWLIVFGFAAVFIPLYFVSAGIRADTVRLNGDLQLVQKSLSIAPTPLPDVQKIMDELARVEGPAQEIKNANATIQAGRADWRAVMAAIGNYNPADLTLTSLTQPTTTQIMLTGQARDDSVVTAYARALEKSNLFSRVIVQSIQVITFTATPTGTVGPGGAVPTPTGAITSTPLAPVGDQYEVDDFQAKDIILGQPQVHSFYPMYDVDKVKFLAKRGRFYRVYTSDLAPGVDTFLNVNAGGTIYINDDRQPGDLSSEVLFQVTGSSDAQVMVTITNRGQYGPDKWYQITVEEILPTPTPTSTVTPTPTPTNTGVPSPTRTNTPTPTPDVRDPYEPDDVEAKPIALGQTQRHNFYPAGDVDKTKFLAKNGRFYRVWTSDLSPGVDTVLSVNVGGTLYVNDDREPHQPGDLSSEVVFQCVTGSDVDVIVTVTNKGQSGPDKWYQVTVLEVIPTPTPTPPPTATPSSTPTTVAPTATATASSTPTPTPTATSTQTITSSLNLSLPGLASLMPEGGFHHPLVALARPALAMAARAAPLCAASCGYKPLAEGDINPPDGLNDQANPQAVEFVIVLELKAKSP